MSYYNYDFDLAAIVIMIITMIQFARVKHIANMKNISLFCLIASVLLTAVFDIAGGMVIEAQASKGWVICCNMAYYIMEQLILFFFFTYVMSWVELGTRMSLVKKMLVLIPIIAILAIIITNPLHGLIFSYENGEFKRGMLRILCYVIPVFYFIWSVIYVFMGVKIFDREQKGILLISALVNLAGRVVQYFNPNLLIHLFVLAVCTTSLFNYFRNRENFIDSETGLANTAHLAEKVKKLIHNKQPFLSIMVRIVDYDMIMASYGNEFVEKFMVEVGKYLAGFVKTGRSFKTGRSSFVINFSCHSNDEKLQKEICDRLMSPWVIDDIEINCAVFVTSIRYPENYGDADTFLSMLNYFKKMHRMRYGIIPVSEFGIKDKVREQKVEKAIEQALKHGGFEMYYQPICIAKNRKFVTAEALIRLTDLEMGPISPAEFIPIAEQNGTIVRIGNFVLDAVCDFVEKNDMDSLGLDYIELNLSTVQCLQRDFIETLDRIVTSHNISPKRLCLEITETASNCAPAVFTENLEKLSKRGYLLALDDFGSGYANLQRMISSSFDIVKFDKDMIQTSCEDDTLKEVLIKLQNVIHTMDSEIVAEGVETAEQYEFLKNNGIDFIQGYYFSKPLPAATFIEFLRKNKTQDNFGGENKCLN